MESFLSNHQVTDSATELTIDKYTYKHFNLNNSINYLIIPDSYNDTPISTEFDCSMDDAKLLPKTVVIKILSQ